jgi:hypothetical protein
MVNKKTALDVFRNKKFKQGKSCITRADLEDMPCPLYTGMLSDKKMQTIVDSLKDQKCTEEDWWKNFEQGAIEQGAIYYEDMPEDTYNMVSDFYERMSEIKLK